MHSPKSLTISVRYLSKTKLMAGCQCPRRLWLDVYAPERAEVSAATERAFAIGHEVGEVAQRLWPDGILIGHDEELAQALEETAERLAQPGPVTLFEATFRTEGVLIRADILERNAQGQIRLVEVKASTSVKPHYMDDCAIQAWVLLQSGFPPERVELAHVNNQFVYGGDGDYQGLLSLADVTDTVRSRQPAIPRLVSELRDMLAEDEPLIEVGRHCHQPYDCPFLIYCTPPQPDYPVTALPGGKRAAGELMAEGIEGIREVPPGRLKNETADWVRAVTVAGQHELRPAAAAELATLGWPRCYFDFETVSFAVPIWAGTRPYQALPFQWSCHVEYPDGTEAHHEFLADGDTAPMRACAEALIEALGDEGPVLVYTRYEQGVLRDLAGWFPDLAPQLEAILARLYDLHPLTRANYYHPDMLGSWSLKKVLPTVAPDLSHHELDMVREGAEASEAFLQLLDSNLGSDERRALRHALLDYCKLDTLALVRLARFLGATPAVG
jgi:hypothetical protein